MNTHPTITIDGTDGGGQLLRTALALSAVTETPFRIENVRGARPDPGLKPQHCTAVELVAELCDADVDGAEIGSDSLTVRPGSARRTPLQVGVGTAGSVTLLFDTVLPIAATYDDPFSLTATGGTNVKWSPTVEYHELVKAPLLQNWGLKTTVDCAKTGFYPAGGGEATIETTPSALSSFDLDARGTLDTVEIYSKASEELSEAEVADRQADRAREALQEAGLPAERRRVEYVSTLSTGSSLLLRGVYEHSVVGFDALGERGRTSEAVADSAVQQFTAFHANDAPVDVYMADQLMTVLALAGGRVRIPSVSEHVRTNLEVVTAFGSDMTLGRTTDGEPVLEASPLSAVHSS
ncbi:RNA 3'-terminal phosphate cyclase [Halobaculum limi]|uniref:RNA 3'-terminal phosphate cyclase n=1 Tax=Halobaculum limi TaxID=3031916 RepID=UPI0024059480|nr:RNA 3'-terminal phosphate cyclase [Halobaculum sp. YSMS11]